jgi:hypothetical protein
MTIFLEYLLIVMMKWNFFISLLIYLITVDIDIIIELLNPIICIIYFMNHSDEEERNNISKEK